MTIPYFSLIQSAVLRVEHFADENPLRHSNDPMQINMIIRRALLHPDWTTNQLRDWHDSQSEAPVKFKLHGFLRRHFILKRDGREDCSKEIERQIRNFQLLLHGNIEEARSALLDLRERQGRLRRSWPVVTRMVLFSFGEYLVNTGDEEDRALGNRIRDIMDRVLVKQSNKLFSRTIRGISEERNLIQRESVSDKLTGLIEEVDELHQRSEDESVDLEALRDENADLKSALFGLKQELSDLSIRIQEMKEVTETEAVVAFLSEMNSSTSGFLLDNLVQSNRAVVDLLERGWLPDPPEVEGVVYSLKMLIEHLHRIGVSPMRIIGERAKIAMDDLSYISYAGSEFKDGGEYKWVEYRSPGWMYGSDFISRPQAVEIDPPIDERGGES